MIEIDADSGPLFGRATRQARQPSMLAPKEVVLTFDDGPTPKVTHSILDTLADNCTRATFFPVGQRASRFPDLVAAIRAGGHTIGSHTWSHPLDLTKIEPGKARDQIERGFAAVALASDGPIAPFFRFPGLNDSKDLLAYTQSRRLASFSVDIITDDSFAKSTTQLIDMTLKRIEAAQGGIVLFHDLQPLTANALPVILRQLKAGGYKVVHLTAKAAFVPDRGYDSVLGPRVAKARTSRPASDATDVAAIVPPPEAAVTRIAPRQALFDDPGGAVATAPAGPPGPPRIVGWRTSIGHAD